ncbi:DoxX family protein [Cytobacillus horneckiae]|uniref:DoxX family protein n=1 Tax=Cytobacillus horneckiae TaxID=549687 RepID=UPI003D208C9D
MKTFFRAVYSLILLGAGVMHFVKEKQFRSIVPKALPFKKAIVLISGVMEIAFALLLWSRKGQVIIGKLLSLFMIVISPANINMAVKNNTYYKGKKLHPLILWLRLPLQIPLIMGALKLSANSSETKEN